MSKSEIRRKHDEDTTKLHRRSLPASSIYKEGSLGRAIGGTTKDAQEDKVEGPSVSLQEEDEARGVPHGVGRPQGLAKPGRPPVQVHYEEESCWRSLSTHFIPCLSLIMP